MNRTPLALLLAMLVASAGAAAEYRWVDQDGRVHFGDAPPPEAKSVNRLDLRGSNSADAFKDFPFELRRAAERFPVSLYTAAGCQPCDAARSLLRQRGIPFAERTIASEGDDKELQRTTGGNRLPVLMIGRQSQVGFEPDAWIASLDAAGYPRSSLLPRNYQAPAPQALTRPPEPAAGPAQTAAAPK